MQIARKEGDKRSWRAAFFDFLRIFEAESHWLFLFKRVKRDGFHFALDDGCCFSFRVFSTKVDIFIQNERPLPE